MTQTKSSPPKPSDAKPESKPAKPVSPRELQQRGSFRDKTVTK